MPGEGEKPQMEEWLEAAALIEKSFRAWRQGIAISNHDDATKAGMREYCESLIKGASEQFAVAGIELNVSDT